VPRGERISAPVSLTDVVPTILGLVGAPSHMERDGLDLRSYWEHPESIPAERVLFAEADHNNLDAEGNKVTDILKMIRVGDRKFILDERDGSLQLFDIGSDPLERANAVETDPETAARLRKLLDEFLATEETPMMLEELTPEEIEELQRLGY